MGNDQRQTVHCQFHQPCHGVGTLSRQGTCKSISICISVSGNHQYASRRPTLTLYSHRSQALYGNPQPNGMFSVVDVRDVALAHILCIETPAANGKRFILDGDGYVGDATRGNVIAINDVLAKCRTLFPEYQFTDAPGPYTGLDPIPLGFRTTDNTLSTFFLNASHHC